MVVLPYVDIFKKKASAPGLALLYGIDGDYSSVERVSASRASFDLMLGSSSP